MSSIRGVVAASVVVILLLNDRVYGDGEVVPIRLVDASAAVCLEIPQFEATWSKLQDSRLVARLKEFPPVQRFLAGPGFQKWTLIDEYARQATGKSVTAHLVGAFSESVVVAIYLPDGKPPQGVLIAQARDAAALKQTLLAWSKLEPEHVARSLEHRGHSYTRRAKSANSAEVVYYTVFGRTIALSDQERLIKQVIEFHEAARDAGTAAATTPQVLGDSSHFRTSRTRLPADGAAFLFLNPRMWEKVISGTTQTSDAAWVQPVVRSLSAISASLRLDDEVVVDLVAEANGTQIPSEWKQLVSSSGPANDWNSRIPAGAIATISSRLDLASLIQGWMASSASSTTDDFLRGRNLLKSVLLGRDLFNDIVPQLLRDWTVSLVSTDGSSADQTPVNLMGQFAIDGSLSGSGVPVDASIDNGIQFAMTALGAMLSHQRGTGRDPLVMVESTASTDGPIRSLTGLKTWSPAYRISSKVLRVTTSRSMLTTIPDGPNKPSETVNPRLSDFEERYFRSTTQLAWLDATRLRAVLGRNREWIARQVDQDSAEGRDRVLKHLAKVEEVIKVFDAAFVAARLEEDHIHVVFGVALDRRE